MKNKLVERLRSSIMDSLERSSDRIEDSVNAMDSCIKSDGESPARVIILESKKKIPNFTLRLLLSLIPNKIALTSGRKEAIRSLSNNPKKYLNSIDQKTLNEFEVYAKHLGIGAIGYAKLPRKLIFKDKAVLFSDTIIMTMEMDKRRIDMAPSLDTMRTVIETYASLGKVTNSLAAFLRKKGFAVHAGHPYKGLALYPPLAVQAGLGWFGRHGLLITPQFGPRQRIAALFTSIENLPFCDTNQHQWIADFCKICGRCIRYCPGKAIRNEPIVYESGRKTHIENDKCFPHFYENTSCAVCLSECTFNREGYHVVKSKFYAMRKEQGCASHNL